ncbi:hypothetical protein GN316_13380 [Xylophilus sp. Kf1]|nr:hypothetical protein [Xylophilus sp. Kf1]
MEYLRTIRWRNSRLSVLVGSIVFLSDVRALTLPELLRAATETHPTVQAARQGVNAANEDVTVARRQYWPTPSALVESGAPNRLQTPTQLLRVEQTLWDFGLTKANVNVAERGSDIASAALETQRQVIGLQVVEAWGTLLASYGRIRVAEAMLQRLQTHESMMLRRVRGELSTRIDLDLVRSRILQAQVELTQARTGVQLSITRLQNLAGMPGLESRLDPPPALPSQARLDRQLRSFEQTDWDSAAQRQPAVLRAEEELRQGQERISAKIAQSRPQIYARFDQAVNGRHDSAVYLGLRYTPGAGFSNIAEESALAARALALEQSAHAARIEARQSLELDRDNLRDAGLRAQSLDAAVQGAQRVFESYERQFTAGRKTWIDLMNAVREVAQNAYSLVDANAAQATALHRLQLRIDPASIEAQVEPDAQPLLVATVPEHAPEDNEDALVPVLKLSTELSIAPVVEDLTTSR